MFLIVFFTGNKHEKPWKLTKFTSDSGKTFWQAESSNISYEVRKGEQEDRFNNCAFTEKDQVLLSTLYNYFIIDKKLHLK